MARSPFVASSQGRNMYLTPEEKVVLVTRLGYLSATLGREPTPQDIVDDARPVDSPLHHHFNWDDESAAQKHRDRQTSDLVLALRIHVPQPPVVWICKVHG